MYTWIDGTKVIETIETLQRRITARFPDSGLSKVAAELRHIGNQAVARAEAIRRPNVWFRIVSGLALALGFILVLRVLVHLKLTDELSTLGEFIQFCEAALQTVVFTGAAIVFLVSAETRLKRRRALEAIHELRALAHIIDMHQLAKDPERVGRNVPMTAASVKLTLTAFELGRYLDYCTELLALVSKIAALYVQDFPDPIALQAVDQVEDLTSGLSRKIWQKIMILDRILGEQQAAQDKA